jgi:hypothetical protein
LGTVTVSANRPAVTPRSLLLGAALCSALGWAAPYVMHVLHASYLALDFSCPGATAEQRDLVGVGDLHDLGYSFCGLGKQHHLRARLIHPAIVFVETQILFSIEVSLHPHRFHQPLARFRWDHLQSSSEQGFNVANQIR